MLLTRRQALSTLGALALPWKNLLAQTDTATPVRAQPPDPAGLSPDLANLHAVIEQIALQRPLHHSFLDPQWNEIEAWKSVVRPFLSERLAYEPKTVPLRADVVSRETRDGFTIERVEIAATPAYSIPAHVLIPAGRKGRLPAVVALHGHGGGYTWGHETLVSHPDDSHELQAKRESTYGGAWAETLARRGFVVVVSDAFYFGARRLRVEDITPDRVLSEAAEACELARTFPPESVEWRRGVNRACWLYESLTCRNLVAAGVTWPGLIAWDDRRTVDYLATRVEVDPERIGCGGLSLGGMRSALLAATDPRIKAAAVTGWMRQSLLQHRNHLRHHTWMTLVPGAHAAMDFPDIAALHAPGALLVQQCNQDSLYPLPAMQGAVDHLHQVYAKAGIAERFRGTFYEETHKFRPHMQEEAFAWFERWL